MATYITSDCINCGACEPECPNEAISEGDEIYVIDPELCTECVGFYDHEACQAVCPVECCLPNPDHREEEQMLLERAVKLHPDDDELKKRVASELVSVPLPQVKRAAGLAAGLALLVVLSGCGGGLPLLHPARTLPQGDVRASARCSFASSQPSS